MSLYYDNTCTAYRESDVSYIPEREKCTGVAYEDNGGYSFTNMNTGLGVEPQMMHVLSNEETVAYMERNKQAVPLLQEGITYIATQKGVKEIVPKKRYVFNVYNADGMPGDGWCGLSNTWLTPDSFWKYTAGYECHIPAFYYWARACFS